MAKTDYRYFVRSPDGRAIYGFEKLIGAETAARAYGDGAQIVDTLAQAYFPMLQVVALGEIVYAGFGGWEAARLADDRDLAGCVMTPSIREVGALAQRVCWRGCGRCCGAS